MGRQIFRDAFVRVSSWWGLSPEEQRILEDKITERGSFENGVALMVGVTAMLGNLFDDDCAAERQWLNTKIGSHSPMEHIMGDGKRGLWRVKLMAEDACNFR